jgi:aminoglycoside 6'-N-acetyltransferase I
MIRKAEEGDLAAAAALAAALWPENGEAALAEEFRALLESGNGALFLASEAGEDAGFAQVQLRHDYVEGAKTSPVGYLEGVYVREEARGRGVARGLLAACEAWAAEMGCREFASDCELDNAASLAFHRKTGFREANRIICFVKPLDPERGEKHER